MVWECFSAYAPGYAPRPKASKFQPIPVGHTLRYALNLYARICAEVCAEPEAPMGCLGQSSFESRYAPGIRQPHSSPVIWIQLEHGQDQTPFGARVCVKGMRWERDPIRPHQAQGYASRVCARVCDNE